MKIKLILLFFVASGFLSAQSKPASGPAPEDSLIVKAELIKKLDKEIADVQSELEKRYFELLANDPATVERLKALAATDAAANQLVGALNQLKKTKSNIENKELKK